ncbi:MAG: shikimate kinase [Adlercreutzia sp.]
MAERMELTRPVFFVGFMGAGKTSVARRLARTCGVASVDMDTYIERREGKKVKEIRRGRPGGIPRHRDGRCASWAPSPTLCSSLRAAAWWSRRPTTTSSAGRLRGVSGSDRRHPPAASAIPPGLVPEPGSGPSPLRATAAVRAVADVRVSTAGKSVPAIAREVQRILEKEGILCPQQR